MSSGICEYFKKNYCVYILQSRNIRYIGRIYIGFTVNPNRRIKQHNAGVAHGGANKTNHKGPWEMVLVIHGFPHEILALRFEWAWQHPFLSRRLKQVKKKILHESQLSYHLRILNEMLQTGPWARLPLHVQWLRESLMTEIDPKSYLYFISYPSGIPGVYSVKSIPTTQKVLPPIDSPLNLCFSCDQYICSTKSLICPNLGCNKSFHVECLAKYFLVNEHEVIPLKGNCPSCNEDLIWCDVISANDYTL
ncbi:structure-specific endonuclease subunit slx1 [Halyomorpha halys]|uniref:structure-specific endonuclease subunit slx1 n=1 Tax=Halyomorpha halys TaxID=286706 RepID=UPI0006D4E19C|nr:structure-specific endonuclease subunit slx1 [Halyomorpha halys]